jgi:hypothetical protein
LVQSTSDLVANNLDAERSEELFAMAWVCLRVGEARQAVLRGLAVDALLLGRVLGAAAGTTRCLRVDYREHHGEEQDLLVSSRLAPDLVGERLRSYLLALVPR